MTNSQDLWRLNPQTGLLAHLLLTGCNALPLLPLGLQVLLTAMIVMREGQTDKLVSAHTSKAWHRTHRGSPPSRLARHLRPASAARELLLHFRRNWTCTVFGRLCQETDIVCIGSFIGQLPYDGSAVVSRQVVASLLSSAVMVGFKANLCNSILRSAVLRKPAI